MAVSMAVLRVLEAEGGVDMLTLRIRCRPFAGRILGAGGGSVLRAGHGPPVKNARAGDASSTGR